MEILKASAGSGKTYRLSHKYLDILKNSSEKDAYRHILAVTFTNKATAEMKSRILKDLKEVSEKESWAEEALKSILHDYGSFSISTIDRFFQQALKGFSRELGHFADYRIELDDDSLVAETVGRILDSITEERAELINWIEISIEESLSKGEKFDIEGGLLQMGKLLRSEEFRDICSREGVDVEASFDKERLAALRKDCRSLMEECSAKIDGIKGDCKVDMSGWLTPFKPNSPTRRKNPELAGYVDSVCVEYNTAYIINRLIYSLGLAAEFRKEYDALLREKNVMCLDESNALLKDIIDGSDAPFVYEKMGVRYNDFLLDEFQDTSLLQWENFRPLLEEAESRGGDNLIVGDVKQSIYGWRNSEWSLLGYEVNRQFPSARTTPMKENWRSTPNVVKFNNGFFSYAASALGVGELYGDVEQSDRHEEQGEPQEGNVKVTFTSDVLGETLGSVTRARKAGARWNDIAVLVRGHREGGLIAAHLLKNGVPVISSDSLNVKTSLSVRRLVSLLHAVDNPDDGINSWLAASLNVTLPERYHSVVDLCESLARQLRALDPVAFDGESMYVQAFMDELQAWTFDNGNKLKDFLKYWEGKTLFVGAPENSDAVRIMTIHKSKGLEFPYAVFAFADSVNLYKPAVHWCADGGRLYPVNLSSRCLDSNFAPAYEEERKKQIVDNLNLFYVAMTRAEKCLHVISDMPSKTFLDDFSKGKSRDWVSVSEILYARLGGNDYEDPVMYDFGKMKRRPSGKVNVIPNHYASYPLSGRLVPSTDAVDFFGTEGLVGVQASPRLDGIWLHGILEKVDSAEELREAVDSTLADGQYSDSEADSAYRLLSERIASHPEWFGSGTSRRYFNERSLIGPDGCEYRPDRVVIDGDRVVIIDYKFGAPRDRYAGQVRHYVELYRSLGYSDVRGCIWYVRPDRVESV